MTQPPSKMSADCHKKAGTRLLGNSGWVALLLLPAILWVARAGGDLFTLYQVQTQDLQILLLLPVGLLLLDRWPPAWELPAARLLILPIALTSCGIVLFLYWGTYSLMANFPLSRDEHMVVFDMAVYERWRFAAPLAPQWRDYAEPLVPAFLLNPVQPIGLVSDYLPVNALMRLAFSRLADPALYNPVLVIAGGVALTDVCKKLFVTDRRAQLVVLLVYASSTQMLVNAMTTYAMTGHMALNLIWLAAFLRGGRSGHAIAIGTAFLATGLHQLIFHPLFAAPFVLWRRREEGWRTALLYLFTYTLIVGWWIGFPMIASLQTGVVPMGQGEHDSFFADKVVQLLSHRDPNTVALMTLNLLRFVAWQNLALVPLLLAALPVAIRLKGIEAPLVAGIGIAILAITIILPYQGHGWGYRYLHPFLGSFALLAGVGYRRLALSNPRRTDGMFITLTLLTLFGSMPLLFARTSQFVAPHAALERKIARTNADFVLIDTEAARALDGRWAINAIDHVRNHPDLTNRPLRFSSRAVDAKAVRALCRRGTVSVVTRSDMRVVGFGLNLPISSPRFEHLTRLLAEEGCLVR